MTDTSRIVTVFGSARVKEGQALYTSAQRLGYALAQAGWTVCNGGYGGTMEACARGAKEASGKTIGITCRIFSKAVVNRYIDHVVETDTLFDRLTQLIELGQGYIVLPGGSGTLVELATVWEMRTKKLMAEKPVIVMGKFWEPVVRVASTERPQSKDYITFASDPDDVVRILQQQ